MIHEGVGPDLGVEGLVMNVRMLAAMTSQIEHGIHDIDEGAKASRTASAEARRTVRASAEQLAGLAKVVEEVGAVVKAISTIANQTNMLALNAKIEAARAGDAGRGFGVVATEVRELARSTAQAADEITKKIRAIRTAATNASALMHDAEASVERIDDLGERVVKTVAEENELVATVGSYVAEATSSVDGIARMLAQASETGEMACP